MDSRGTGVREAGGGQRCAEQRREGPKEKPDRARRRPLRASNFPWGSRWEAGHRDRVKAKSFF